MALSVYETVSPYNGVILSLLKRLLHYPYFYYVHIFEGTKEREKKIKDSLKGWVHIKLK
jgi:hypothetical protein